MIKKIINRILFPHTYSSQAYTDYLKKHGVKIGKNTRFYAPKEHTVDAANGMFIEIGDQVQIGNGVTILAHDYSFSVLANTFHDFPRKQTVTKIGNNVFIGQNALVTMGAQIGDNVIIGAGSVVTGKVESNSVYAGNPARKICTLEELLYKNRSHFINSAKTYAIQFEKCYKRLPNPEEMKIYQALFVDPEKLKNYVKTENYGFTITDQAKENITMDYQRFESVKQLLSWQEP